MGQIQNSLNSVASTVEGSVKSLLLKKMKSASETPQVENKPVKTPNIQPLGNSQPTSFGGSMPTSPSDSLNYSTDYQRYAPMPYDKQKAQTAKQKLNIQLMNIKDLQRLMGVI